MLKLIDIFNREIDFLKQDENTLSIVLVGSSKNLDLKKDADKINDIDLFIFTKSQQKNQIRINKTVNDIEFDLNFISKEGCEYFINNKEYFFLNIYDGKILYDNQDYGKNILIKCGDFYKKGPDVLSKEAKNGKIAEVLSEIEKLKQRNNFNDFEYDFFVNLNLRNLIRLYYIKNDKWIPKDKKLIKSIKSDDIYIYDLLKGLKNNEYKILNKIFNYIVYEN